MRVRITAAIAGEAFSYIGGEVVDLDEPTARSWCSAGMAELVEPGGETPEDAALPEVPEVAAVETPESAAPRPSTRAAKPRTRRS